MPKDFFGTEIKVGDFVVTPATQYQSGVLRMGVVEKIGIRKPTGWYSAKAVETVTVKRFMRSSSDSIDVDKPSTRRHHITDFDSIVVIQSNLLPKDSKGTQALTKVREEIFKSKV